MTFLIKKLKRRIRIKFVNYFKNSKIYNFFYVSFWHYLLIKPKTYNNSNLYFSAVPNRGAGIGHQLANWIAGYYFSQYFDLKFAHIPFASDKWEHFLGFYQNEVTVNELLKNGYKLVRIPLFNEQDNKQIEIIKKIILSYSGERIVFLAEQDQFYRAQYPISEVLKQKFYSCPVRKEENLIFNKDEFNIAIHVRRGDIVQNNGRENPNLTMRFQDNEYFINALNIALENFKDENNIHIYLFSQGKKEDFKEFEQFNNLTFCLDLDPQSSFLHMVYADALITSKSSFSYKPALLNNGIKFCPKDFWHDYPDDENWILI